MNLAPPTGSAPDFDVSRAAEAGLLDVVYCEVDTPVGRVVAARTPRGLARLAYEDFNGGVGAGVRAPAAPPSPRLLRTPPPPDDARRPPHEDIYGAPPGL